MMTQSGCFGRNNAVDPIDDTQEAAQTVEEIVDGMQPASDQSGVVAPTVFALSMVWQRMRMLTWAVALIALYLVLKETK